VAAPLVDGNGVALKLCGRVGCHNRAVVFPELAIPPTGRPHTQALKMQIGIALCRKHGLEERPETFLTDQLKEMVRAMLKPSPIPPDFDRARINLKPIGGEEWNRSVGIAREAQAGRRRRLNS
jgi:hypothetical protein